MSLYYLIDYRLYYIGSPKSLQRSIASMRIAIKPPVCASSTPRCAFTVLHDHRYLCLSKCNWMMTLCLWQALCILRQRFSNFAVVHNDCGVNNVKQSTGLTRLESALTHTTQCNYTPRPVVPLTPCMLLLGLTIRLLFLSGPRRRSQAKYKR